MSLLLDSIYNHSQTRPNAIALSDANTKNISYRQLQNIISANSSFDKYSGHVIASDVENSISWALLDLLFIKSDVLSVPLPSFFTAQQRLNAINDSNASIFISDKPFENYQLTILLEGEILYLKQLHTNKSKNNSAGKVTYTSGTTGSPKGVHLSLNSMERVASSLLEVIGAEAAARHMAVLPMPVLLENVAGLYATLLAGGNYIIQPLSEIGFEKPFQPDLLKLSAELARTHATSCILVPELLKGLLYAIRVSETTLPEMKFIAVGGANVPPKLLELSSALNLPVYQGYGLSEMASVVAVNTPSQSRAGSVGKILPHLKYTIAADGELLIESEGMIHATGDIAKIDDDGYLYITGRKKNVLINSFGRNVSPEWPESELLNYPEILQAYVYGDGQPTLSALIVPSTEEVTNTRISEIIDRVNNILPEYAHIARFDAVMPFTTQNGLLTANGRMKRAEINKFYLKQGV